MSFKPGHKKIGGRAKGVPNRFTRSVLQICEEMGYDPVAGLIELATRGEEESNRVTAAKELMKYIYPQRKAIEHSGSVDTGLQQMIESLEGKTEDELAKIATGSNSPTNSKKA